MMMVMMPVAGLVGILMLLVAAAEVKPGIGRGAADQCKSQSARCKKFRHGSS
jgi:hypothetical protein